jgi:hypothetical protein
MERLRFIERTAYWRGTVNRQDLVEVFGVSSPQASADLQRYHEINPGALVYSLNRKRYESAPEMRCVMQQSNLDEAVRLYLGPSGPAPALPRLEGRAGMEDRVDFVALPRREAPMEVQRRVFLAVAGGKKLEVRYLSVHGRREAKRWIAPHAFGHDGYRWHVRAFCLENRDYRDFVLGRIAEAAWPADWEEDVPADAAWQTFVRVTLAPNSELDAAQQAALALDYNLKGGRLDLIVREAMLDYTLAHLRLPSRDGRKLPQHLNVVEITPLRKK